MPGYCFLEPRYSSGVEEGTFRPQNDQHPDSDINEGEHLIYSIYKAIRSNRKVWEHSMLVIVYDEWGGFFEHVVPPRADAPTTPSAGHKRRWKHRSDGSGADGPRDRRSVVRSA